MELFIVTFLVFLFVMFAMALGWIFNRKPITGSCGGLNSIYQGEGGKIENCGICGAKVDEACQSELKKRLR